MPRGDIFVGSQKQNGTELQIELSILAEEIDRKNEILTGRVIPVTIYILDNKFIGLEVKAASLEDLELVHISLRPYRAILNPQNLKPGLVLPATNNADYISSALENFYK